MMGAGFRPVIILCMCAIFIGLPYLFEVKNTHILEEKCVG
jgi:hypothetical protein